MLVKAEKNYPETPAKKISLTKNLFALVDPALYDSINRHKWYAKKSFSKFYAARFICTKKRKTVIFMHRIIADTPAGLVCHHINHNSLDNRRANLQNLTWFDHAKLHSWR